MALAAAAGVLFGVSDVEASQPLDPRRLFSPLRAAVGDL
jgi:hypothetical protein